VLVRIQASGDESEIAVDPDQNWAALAKTIEAMAPDRIELYDADGKLLRADARTRERDVMPPGLANDPQAQTLLLFGNLLARAYEHSTDVAFGRMVEVMQLQTEQMQSALARMQVLEHRYFEAMSDATALANAPAVVAEAEQSPLEGLASAFLGGMSGGKSDG